MTDGRSKGGAARMAKLTPEERRANAVAAAEAKKRKAGLPRVTHDGTLNILGVEIPCYVLSDGSRVLSQRGISEAFTGTRGGGTSEIGKQKIPRFLAKRDIKLFINDELMARINNPVEFLPKAGRSAFGFDAQLLPEICEVVIDASRAANDTNSMQYLVADKLIRGFARVGITALIDEVTGYQKDRARDALAKILEAYVAKELQPYIRTFDPDYYEQMFRLRGLRYPPDGESQSQRPQYFGKLTNDIVYKRLAPGVLEALKEEAKKLDKQSKLFQHLSAGFGRQELLKHLGLVVGLMKVSKDWDYFINLLDSVSPKYGDTKRLDLDDPASNI